MKLSDIAAPVALTIVSVWAIITLASLVTGEYDALPYTTSIMAIAAGALFGLHINGGRRGKP